MKGPNMSGIDLTNTNQKIFAGVLVIATLIALNYLLPPFIFIMKNLWIAAILAAPVVYIALNPSQVWSWYKLLSWKMTKWAISADKLGFMYRYYDYILGRIANLEKNLQNVSAMRVKAQRRVQELKDTIENDKREAIGLKERGASQLVLRSIANKVTINTKTLETLLPRAANVYTQEKYLIELRDNMKADAEDLKFTLDAKAEEYKLLKELSSASDSASQFMNSNSQEAKMYKESLVQIEDAASQYIANIQNFERNAKPFIERLSVGREVSEDEGLRLIEEFQKERVTLKIEDTAEPL